MNGMDRQRVERGILTAVNSTALEKMVAIAEVQELLLRYRGERVDKGRHPLHAAVMGLERLCFRNNRTGDHVLWCPAKRLWFSLLWASRGQKRVRDSFLDFDRLDGVPDGDWAMLKAEELLAELQAEMGLLLEVN